ncbi:alpha/beta fold hydrolase [Cellulomonas hominis]
MTAGTGPATPLHVHRLREGRGSGTPLVLLHAFPLDARMWVPAADRLPADRGVLAVDLPGMGASRDVPLPEPSLEAAADAVADSLRALGLDRVVLAGLSMGGYVAMALLERHPGLVAGLGLLDTKSTADPEAARANRLRVADAVEARGTVDEVLGMASTLLGPTTVATRPGLVTTVAGWIGDQTPRGVAWSQRAMAARPDRTAVLATLDGPALVLVGAQDEVTPLSAARAMADALPHARLVVAPDAGHLSALEDPAEVAVALDGLVAAVG